MLQVSLTNTERGITSPGETTRIKLQKMFDCKINWLDVPRLNIEALDPPSDWNSCERDLRRLIRQLKSLPEDEQVEFIRSAKKHLGDINKQRNENSINQ